MRPARSLLLRQYLKSCRLYRYSIERWARRHWREPVACNKPIPMPRQHVTVAGVCCVPPPDVDGGRRNEAPFHRASLRACLNRRIMGGLTCLDQSFDISGAGSGRLPARCRGTKAALHSPGVTSRNLQIWRAW